ncbi:MAG: ABC-F family ATP-binding cassette domain-containing protein [Saprospiraceae bacterium]|nr:ABC-F family ATP-binding cassette domain-containing protein [Saprospiraceae bacterium]MBK9042736.1 ABC-F family ATP-binding cassette domain-containing protein [Saprospiraceae bacterium]
MQYLLLENVSRSYGEKVLFKNVNLSISKGEKIALVAKNGSGKSTLLRVIAGEEGAEGENAKIFISKEIHSSFLTQDPQFEKGATVIESVFDSENPIVLAVRDHERALQSGNAGDLESSVNRLDDLKAWDAEARIKEILDKLKIRDFNQVVDEMSGGQKKRLALAKILIDEPDFLILDEPTNHLDLEMIEWLENFLQNPSITLFMVTHDRYFLDNVCNEIVELENGNFFIYRGNYSSYLEKKDARVQNEASNYEKTKKLYSRELEWMRRQPQARSTKAKSRIDDFYEIKDKVSNKPKQDEVNIQIQAARLGSKILELHQISKKYGDKIILEPFSYKFKPGERIGIIGPNGTGKSSFLKLITNQISPDTGKVVVGDTVVFGYYSQDGLYVNEDKMVIDVIRDIAEFIPLEKGFKLTAEALLERFLFPRPQQRVYVSQLSGGEKRRLYLLTVLMKNPNFLILDEPTNDLDILTLNVLQDYLMDYPGCLIIVTHDRYFMDNMVDHIFILEGEGKVKDYNGSYSEYIFEKKQRKGTVSKEVSEVVNTAEPTVSKMSYEQRKELNRLEKEIEKLEEKKADIAKKFDDRGLGHEEIIKWSAELEKIQNQLEEKEMRWMELAE